MKSKPTFKLTPEQKKIVGHLALGGPALVEAGAGCAKTTTLLATIKKCLLGDGDERILLLSFSVASCEELRARLSALANQNPQIESKLDRVEIKTYSAFGLSIISQNLSHFNYQVQPSVTAKPKKMEPSDYKRQKLANNQIDFDDMVNRVVNKKIGRQLLRAAAQKYDYLLVDELQDTKDNELKMLFILVKAIKTTIMAGDPKQHIYGFEGFSSTNWNEIKNQIKPKIYTLSESKRVPEQSLPFINAIGNNIDCQGLALNSKQQGSAVHLITCKNSAEQAQFIANQIQILINQGVKPNQIACLGRTKLLLSDLNIALASHQIASHESYRNHNSRENHLKSFRKLLNLTKSLRNQAAINPKTLLTILKRLGVNKATAEKLLVNLAVKGWHKAVKIPSRKKGKEDPVARKVTKFRQLVTQAAKSNELEKAIAHLIKAQSRIFRSKYLKQQVDFMRKDLSQLKSKVRELRYDWNSLPIRNLTLNSHSDEVHLSTINKAKGKEWQYVFVIHCVEGILPIYHSKNNASKRDLELNLLYVACTRHKKCVYLMQTPGTMTTYKKKRRHQNKYSDLSTFIENHTGHTIQKTANGTIL